MLIESWLYLLIQDKLATNSETCYSWYSWYSFGIKKGITSKFLLHVFTNTTLVSKKYFGLKKEITNRLLLPSCIYRDSWSLLLLVFSIQVDSNANFLWMWCRAGMLAFDRMCSHLIDWEEDVAWCQRAPRCSLVARGERFASTMECCFLAPSTQMAKFWKLSQDASHCSKGFLSMLQRWNGLIPAAALDSG